MRPNPALGLGELVNEQSATRALYRGVVLLVTLAVVVGLVVLLHPVLLQIIAALVLAAAVTPLVHLLTGSERALRWRWRPPKVLVILTTYLVFAIVVLTLGITAFSILFGELATLANQFPAIAAEVRGWITSLTAANPTLGDSLRGWLLGLAETILSAIPQAILGALGLLGGVGALFGSFLTLLFILFMALYFAIDGPRVRNYFLVFLPWDRQDQATVILSRIVERLGRWVQGIGTMMVTIGLVNWIGLSLIGVPYATLLAVIAAFAELIPGVGPFIAAGPAIVLAFTVSPVHGIITIIFALIVSQVENNVLAPKIMSRAVKFHPLVVFGSLLAGAELFGAIGALLAIPVAASIAVVVDEVRAERLAARPQTPEPATPQH